MRWTYWVATVSGMMMLGCPVTDDDDDSAGDGEALQWTDLSVWHQVCGIQTDGLVDCWGDCEHGRCDAPQSGEFDDVSAGEYHTCAVDIDRVVTCWGCDGDVGGVAVDHGQCDAPEGDFTQVSAGRFHTCGVHQDGDIECWGLNDSGQCDSPEGSDFVQVETGDYHTCAVDDPGNLSCWGCQGDTDHGQCDVPEADYRQVSAGNMHTCGLTTLFEIDCWGEHGGDEEILPDHAPAGDYYSVDVNRAHACAMTQDRDITCWAGGVDPWTDQPTADGNDYVMMSVGPDQVCALDGDGHTEIVCWGPGAA